MLFPYLCTLMKLSSPRIRGLNKGPHVHWLQPWSNVMNKCLRWWCLRQIYPVLRHNSHIDYSKNHMLKQGSNQWLPKEVLKSWTWLGNWTTTKSFDLSKGKLRPVLKFNSLIVNDKMFPWQATSASSSCKFPYDESPVRARSHSLYS